MMTSGALPLMSSIGSGLLVGLIPLISFDVGIDPYDQAISYVVWLLGCTFASLVHSMIRPLGVWRWAIAVCSGFLAAVIIHMAARPEAYQLPPLTLLSAVFIGAIPSFAGAYLGKAIGWLKQRH